MGTNFYLMSRNKKLIREPLAVETEYYIKDIGSTIVDEPYLGYKQKGLETISREIIRLAGKLYGKSC